MSELPFKNPGIDPRETKEIKEEVLKMEVEEKAQKEEVKKDEEKPDEERWKVLLDGVPGLTVETIRRWKAEYKKIYTVNLGRIWIFRPLSRLENKMMQADAINRSQQPGQQDRLAQVEEHLAYQEALVRRCVLAPQLKAEDYSGLEAGTLDALQESLLFHSNFLPPELVINMTEEII